jgi:hypothetical protein
MIGLGQLISGPFFATPKSHCDHRPLSTDGRISDQLENYPSGGSFGGSGGGTREERDVDPSLFKQYGLVLHAFYSWRKQLRTARAMTFALVESTPSKDPAMTELVFRLRLNLLNAWARPIRLVTSRASLRARCISGAAGA